MICELDGRLVALNMAPNQKTTNKTHLNESPILFFFVPLIMKSLIGFKAYKPMNTEFVVFSFDRMIMLQAKCID